MKRLLLLFTAFGGLVLSGCESDIGSGTEVPETFKRGIRGGGELFEPDNSPFPESHSYNPAIREELRAGG